MANVQITELATTKTRATIDADAEYLPAEPVAGTSYKMLITEAVAAGLAQATAAIDVADDVTVAGTVTVTPSSDGLVLSVEDAAGTAVVDLYSGTQPHIDLPSYDTGSARGPYIFIGRNANASTAAPGSLAIRRADNAASVTLYPDNSNVWRTSTSAPTSANFASGTVVGTQTSMAAAKDIMPGLSAIDEVAARIQAGADAVRKFAYKSGAYNRQMFEGVVVDEAPEYGMDRDDEHPAGKSLNEIQIIGDLLRMVADLAQRVAELEAK